MIRCEELGRWDDYETKRIVGGGDENEWRQRKCCIWYKVISAEKWIGHSITVMNFYCLIIISKIFNNIVLHLISFILLFPLLPSLSLILWAKAFHEIVFRAFSRCEFIQRFTDNLSVCQEIHLSTVSLKREGANTSIHSLLYVSFFLTHGVQFGIQYTDYLSIITNPKRVKGIFALIFEELMYPGHACWVYISRINL